MATSYRYGEVTYTESDIDAIMQHLVEPPDELPTYEDSTLKTIRGLLSWHAYGPAQVLFAVMCKVLAAARTALGEPVME
jgi:hypothetical protein